MLHLQAEIAMRQSGLPGMSDEEVCWSKTAMIFEWWSFLFLEIWVFCFAGGRFCFEVPSCIQGVSPNPLLRRAEWIGSQSTAPYRDRWWAKSDVDSEVVATDHFFILSYVFFVCADTIIYLLLNIRRKKNVILFFENWLVNVLNLQSNPSYGRWWNLHQNTLHSKYGGNLKCVRLYWNL